jgi:hypothetical protein
MNVLSANLDFKKLNGLPKPLVTGFLAANGVLVLSGVSPRYAVLATMLIGTHTVFGLLILRHYLQDATAKHFIGSGFALGTLIAVCIDQLLVTTPLKNYSFLIPIVAIFLLSLCNKNRNRIQLFTQDMRFPTLILMFLMLVGLIQERYWPLWIALSMLPLVAFTIRANAKFHRLWVLPCWVLTLTTSVTVIKNRPDLWWIKTQDFQFFESLSFSLAHWGARDQVFATGNPILYHWFTFAWTGLITRVIDAPTLLVLTKIGPPIVILFLIYVLDEVLSRFILSASQRITGILVVLLLNDLNFESPSMVFSYIFLIAFVSQIIQFFNDDKISIAVIATALAAGAFAVKSSNVAVLGGALIGVAYFGWQMRSNGLQKIAILIFSVSAGLIFVFMTMYFNSPYGGNIEFGLIGLARDFYGDIAALPRKSYVFWSFFVLLNVMAFYSLVLIQGLRLADFRNNVLLLIFCGSIPMTLLALTISQSVHEQEEYFQHSWVMVGSICLIVIAARLIDDSKRDQIIHRRTLFFSILMICGTWLIQYLIPTDNSGAYRAIRMRILDGSVSVLLIASASIIMLIFSLLRTDLFGFKRPLAFIIAGTAVLTVSLNVRWFHDQNFRNEVTSETHRDYMLGDTGLIQIGEAIQTLTPENAIIASNYFCDDPDCSSEEYSPLRSDWKRGGEAMGLVMYAHRRFLVSGYGYLWQNVRPSDDVIMRMDLSIEFGSSPNEALLAQLLERNVSYFVVDKSKSEVSDWSDFASTVETTDRYILLKLISNT